jgi:uncharacterized protein (DUF58 family)
MLTLSGSINYNLSLGYILTFLLAGMAVVSILHTYRNLAQLRVSAGRCERVFCGDNPSSFARISIGLRHPDGSVSHTDAPARACTRIDLHIATKRRGYLRPGRFSLFCNYPIGLTHAWSNLNFSWTCLVYPAPESGGLPPPPASEHSGAGLATTPGEEDFSGLRNYHPGDPPRHIAWKSSARGDRLLTKQFSGGQGPEQWIEWDTTRSLQDIEQRISRMTRWVLDAEAAHTRYGLRLPNLQIDPGSGSEHRDHCLSALALFEVEK